MCGVAVEHAWIGRGVTSGSRLLLRWARWRSVAERFSKCPRMARLNVVQSFCRWRLAPLARARPKIRERSVGESREGPSGSEFTI
jgi:hypothetical protein